MAYGPLHRASNPGLFPAYRIHCPLCAMERPLLALLCLLFLLETLRERLTVTLKEMSYELFKSLRCAYVVKILVVIINLHASLCAPWYSASYIADRLNSVKVPKCFHQPPR
jgi:hypothetical protein